MPFVIAATASISTYLLLMHVLFEDFDEFRTKVRSTLLWFPVSVVLDYAFGNDSLRAWIWMISGPVVGVLVYSTMSR